MSATQTPSRVAGQDIGPGRVLLGWLIVLFGLLARAVGRTFGVSGADSGLLTLIVLASGARGVRRALAAPGKQIQKARSNPNVAADTLIATAGIKVTVDRVAGRPSANTSFAAALIVFAVLVASVRPAAVRLQKAVRAVIAQVRRLWAWAARRASFVAAMSRESVARATGAPSDAASDQVTSGDR